MDSMDMSTVVKFVHEIGDNIGATASTPDFSFLAIFIGVLAALLAACAFLIVKKRHFSATGPTLLGAHVSGTSANTVGNTKFLWICFATVAALLALSVGGLITTNAIAASASTDKAVFTITKDTNGDTVINGNGNDVLAHVYDNGEIQYDTFTLKNETGDFIEVSKSKLQAITGDNGANWTFKIKDSTQPDIYNGIAYPEGQLVHQRTWTRIETGQTVEVEVSSTVDYATAQTLYDKDTVKLGLDAMIHPVDISSEIQEIFKVLDLDGDCFYDIIKNPQGKDFDFKVDKDSAKDCEIIWVDKDGNEKVINRDSDGKYHIDRGDIKKGGTIVVYEAYLVVVNLGGGTLDVSNAIPAGWQYNSTDKYYYKTFKAGTTVADVKAEWRHDKAYVTKTSGSTVYARYTPDQWDSNFESEYVDMLGGTLVLKWTEGVKLTINNIYSATLAFGDCEHVGYTSAELAAGVVVPKGSAFQFSAFAIGDDAEKTITTKATDDAGNAYTYDALTDLYTSTFSSASTVNLYEYFKATYSMVNAGAYIKTTPSGWTRQDPITNDEDEPITYYQYFPRYLNQTGYNTTGSTILSTLPTSAESYPSVSTEENRKYKYADHWFVGVTGISSSDQLDDNKTFDALWNSKLDATLTVKNQDNTDNTVTNPLVMSITAHDDTTKPYATAKYDVSKCSISTVETAAASPEYAHVIARLLNTADSQTGAAGSPYIENKASVTPTLNGGTDDLEDGYTYFTITYPETDNFQAKVATIYVKIHMLEDDFSLAYEHTGYIIGSDAINMPYNSSATDRLVWTKKSTEQIIKDYSNMTNPEIDAKVVYKDESGQEVDISNLIQIKYNVAYSYNTKTEEDQIDMNLISIAPKLDGKTDAEAKEIIEQVQQLAINHPNFTVTFSLPKSAYYGPTGEHSIDVHITKADSDIVIPGGDDYYVTDPTDPEDEGIKNIYIYSGATANIKLSNTASSTIEKDASGNYKVKLTKDEAAQQLPVYSSMDNKNITVDEDNVYTIPVKAGETVSGTNYDWLQVPFASTDTNEAKTFKFHVYVVEKKSSLEGLDDAEIALGSTITQDLTYVGVPTSTTGYTPTVKIYDGDKDVTSTYFNAASLTYKSISGNKQTWTLTLTAKTYLDSTTTVVPLGNYTVKVDFPKSGDWVDVNDQSTLTLTKKTPTIPSYDPDTGINVSTTVWGTTTTNLSTLVNAPSNYDLSVADGTIVTSTYDPTATGKELSTTGLKATVGTTTPATTTGVLSFDETETTNAASFDINYTVNKADATARWSTAASIGTAANTEYRVACDTKAYTGDGGDKDHPILLVDVSGNTIEGSEVTYDTNTNELVITCSKVIASTACYIKFPATDNCNVHSTKDDTGDGYGLITVEIIKADRNLKLYEVGSKRNEITKGTDGNYAITLTKTTEESITATAQARFNGDNSAPTGQKFQPDGETTGLTVETDDTGVIGTFTCSAINTYTITYTLAETETYNSATVTLKIKFTRTINPDEDLQKYLDDNGSLTVAGAGSTATGNITPINKIEVHPTVQPAADGKNTWTATSSDTSIATATVSDASATAPTITINGITGGSATITIKVTNSAITNDPGATTTIPVTVLGDYAYRKYIVSSNGESNDTTLYSIVKVFDTSKTEIKPEGSINITTYNSSATDKYTTSTITINAIGDPNMTSPLSTSAFSNVKNADLSNLASVYISPYTFYENTTLTSFTGTPSAICTYAFYKCTNLSDANFLNNSTATSIGVGAFYKCQTLQTVKVSSKIKAIEQNAFNQCTSLESVDLSNMPTGSSIGVTTYSTSPSYDAGVFYGCTKLSTVKFNRSGTMEVGAYAFKSCSALSNVENLNATKIHLAAFYGCAGLKLLDLSNSTSLTSITEPSSCTSVASSEGSFCNCSNLEIIKMPSSSSTLNLHSYSFANCSQLKYMTLKHTGQITASTGTFSGCSQLRSFVVAQTSNVSDSWTNIFSGMSASTSVPFMGAGVSGDSTLSGLVTAVTKRDSVNSYYLTYTTLGSSTSISTGYYYMMTSDLTRSTVKYEDTDASSEYDNRACLDLNGHTLKSSSGRALYVNCGDDGIFSNIDGLFRIDDSSAVDKDGSYAVGKITGGSGNEGAGLYFKQFSHIFFVNGNFYKNNAGSNNGGAISMENNDETVGGGSNLFKTYGGYIIGNTASQGGGIYLSDDTTAYVRGTEITENTATSSGGGIYLKNDDGSQSNMNFYKGATCLGNFVNTAMGGVYDADSGNRFQPQTGVTNGVDYYNERSTPTISSNFTYDLNSDKTGLILKGYTGSSTTATVPEYDYTTSGSSTYYLPVVQVGAGSSAVTSSTSGVTLQFDGNSQVTTVDDHAFQDSPFVKVVLPSSVTTLEDLAFYGSKLTSVDLSACTSLTSISNNCFNGSSVLDSSNVSLPATITKIGDEAFASCPKITSLDFLPSSVTTLNECAFENTGLTSVDTSAFSNLKIGYKAFANNTKLGSVNLVNGASTVDKSTSVGGYNFTGCTGLTTVTVNTSGSIASYCFAALDSTPACTGITSVNINCDTVGKYAFAGCTGITSLDVVAKTIGEGAFAQATSTEDSTNTLNGAMTNDDVTFNVQANTVNKNALSGRNGITKLNVKLGGVGTPSATCDVKDSAFANIDNSATSGICELNITKTKGGSLGKNMFAGSAGIKTADFSSTDITSVPEGMFANCTWLDTVWWNKSLETIGKNAFANCINYTDLDMSWATSLKSIEASAFSGCTGITTIYLEENYKLESLGDSVFANLTNLKYVDFPSGQKATSFTSIGDGAFKNSAKLIGDYDTNELEIPCSLTSLGAECFSGCSSIKVVNFEADASGDPGSLTTIGDKTFGGCTSLYDIDFTNTQVKTLHTDASIGAMYGCTNLRTITLPASYTAAIAAGDYGDSANITTVDMTLCTQVTEFAANAFKQKSKLTTIKLPDDPAITKVGNYAFYYCTALKDFDVNDLTELTTVGDYAFYYCSSLPAADFTKLTKLATLGKYSFAYFNNIAKIDLSKCASTLTVIPEGCFQHINTVTELVLPDAIKSVGALAFYGDKNLDNVDFNPTNKATDDLTIEYVGKDAFKGTAHYSNRTYRSDDGIVFDKSKIVAFGIGTDSIPERFELADTTRVVAAYCLDNCSDLRWLIIDETDGHKIYMNEYCLTNCASLTNIVVKRTSSEGNDNITWGDNVLENAGSVGKSDSEHSIVPLVVTGGANTKAKFSSYSGVKAYTFFPVTASGITELCDGYYYYLEAETVSSGTRINTGSSSADCVLDLNGCNLTRNLYSQEAYGQVIAFSGSSLRVDDSSKDGNGMISRGQATWKLGSIQDAGFGGGIYCTNSNVSLYFVRGIIKDCKAYQGGGIYIQNEAKVYMYDGAEITSCTATYSKEMWGGGAIMMAYASEFYMHGGYIHHCRAYNEGGAILANCRFWNSFKIRLYGGTFESNYTGSSGTTRNDITAGVGWTGSYDLAGNLVKNQDYIFREDHWV